MSDTPQTVRVVLGPVARKLIDGKGDNRKQALDEAITALLEASPKDITPSPATEGADARLDALQAILERQTKALQKLSYTSALQHRMTRVLIASLMSETNQDQQTLLALAEQAAQEVHDKTALLGEVEMEMLQDTEAAATVAIQREMERAGVEPVAALDEELER